VGIDCESAYTYLIRETNDNMNPDRKHTHHYWCISNTAVLRISPLSDHNLTFCHRM